MLSFSKNNIFIEKISVADLAEKYGTPLYVYSETRLRENANRLKTALKKHYPHSQLFYAVKANNNPAILKILQSEELGADASCPAEIWLAEKAGFSKDKILYSGVYNKDEELRYGLKSKVAINLDAPSLLPRLLKIGKPPLISFRINPGIGNSGAEKLIMAGPEARFGIFEKDALQCYADAKKAGIKRFGIHMMTGSNVLDPKYFPVVAEKLFDIAGKIAQQVGITFEFIDIGGGLGVPYRGEKELDVDQVISEVAKVFQKKIKTYPLGNPKLMLEPGRYLVCNMGILLTRVTTIKKTKKTFVGIDAGFNTLLRPKLYDAYHEVLVDGQTTATPCEKVSLCGPICENDDILARDRLLPKLKENDLLVFKNAGAYGFGMSSQYNSRPRSAEIMVKGNKARVIRKREEFEDLVRRCC